ILIIILAVLSLLSPLLQQINLEQVIYGMLAVGILLFLLGLVVVIRQRLNDISKLLIVVTGEVLILSITYLFDIAFRSDLTRYSFLGVTMLLFLIGLYLPMYRPLGLYGSAWQLGSVYLGFVSLISFGGSDYYSRLLYSLTMLLVILASHIAIFQSKSIYILFWTIPLEFFTLFQSTVVNSTYLFTTSLIIIGSLPALLYLYRNSLPQIVVSGQNLFERALLLPQIALVFTITNGGLLAPQPEILTSLFVFMWMGYSLVTREETKAMDKAMDVVAPSSSYSSIYVILIIALLGFSLSGQVITSLVLVFLVFLSPIAVTAAPEQLRESMIVNSAVVLGGVAVLFFLRVEIALLYWVLILALVSHIALSYYRYGDLTALIPYYQVWLAATTSFFLLASYELIILLPLNLTAHIAINEFLRRNSLTTSLLITIPGLAAIVLAQDILYQWMVTVIQVIAIAYLITRKVPDLSLNLLVLLSPPVLILAQAVDNTVVNLVVLLLASAAIYLFLESDVVDDQATGSVLFVAALVLRDVAPAEAGIFMSVDVELYVMMAVLALFTIFHVVRHLVLTVPESSELAQLSWYVAVLYALNYLQRNIYEEVQQVVFFSVMTILTIQIVVTRLRGTSSRLRLLSFALLFALPILFTKLEFYYLPWVLLGLIQLWENFTVKEGDPRLDIAFTGLTAINAIVLMFVSSTYNLIALVALFAVILYPGQIQTFLRHYLSDRLMVSLILGGAILVSLLNGILLDITFYSTFESMLLFGIISGMLVSWLLLNPKEGLNSLFAVYIAFTGLFLMQIEFLPLWIMLITLVCTSLAFGFETSLRGKYVSYIGAITPVTLSFVAVTLVILVEFGALLINERVFNFQQYNRILVFVGLALIIAFVLLEYLEFSNHLSISLLYLGGLMFVITTFFGFYEEIISNLLFSTLAIITASIGVYTKREDVFRTGVGLSILSVFKALIDLIYFDQVTRSLSLLMVGIQLIFYVIVVSNLAEDHFPRPVEITEEGSDMEEPEEVPESDEETGEPAK
ncbi:MAG: hypothetical protein ACXAE3_09800, partial [Candidatus Kariarchaeaceae archaeon]